MAENHLLAHLVDAVRNIELTLFLPYPGIEYHMIHQVPYFLGDGGRLTFLDCVAEFIHFFLRKAADATHRLLGIPGALLAQGVHYIKKPPEGG